MHGTGCSLGGARTAGQGVRRSAVKLGVGGSLSPSASNLAVSRPARGGPGRAGAEAHTHPHQPWPGRRAHSRVVVVVVVRARRAVKPPRRFRGRWWVPPDVSADGLLARRTIEAGAPLEVAVAACTATMGRARWRPRRWWRRHGRLARRQARCASLRQGGEGGADRVSARRRPRAVARCKALLAAAPLTDYAAAVRGGMHCRVWADPLAKRCGARQEGIEAHLDRRQARGPVAVRFFGIVAARLRALALDERSRWGVGLRRRRTAGPTAARRRGGSGVGRRWRWCAAKLLSTPYSQSVSLLCSSSVRPPHNAVACSQCHE